MARYWPEGLKLNDLQSPTEILRDAQAEWVTNSGGALTLVLQEAESHDGYGMIIVHAKHETSNRTTTLFSVVCRKGHPYPARLQPKEDELPNFFKKTYKTKSLSSSHSQITSLLAKQLGEEKQVENPWVAETPGEFRKKLEDVFNLGSVKSEVLNLVSSQSKPEVGSSNASEKISPDMDSSLVTTND